MKVKNLLKIGLGCISLLLISCGPVPFASVLGGPAPLTFYGDSGNSSRDLGDIVAHKEVKDLTSRYNSVSDPTLQNWFDAYYTELGSLVASFKPQKFTFPTLSVALINSEQVALIVEDLGANLDFTDPSTATANDVARGFYDYLFILHESRFSLLGIYSDFVNMVSEVEVNTTGYTFTDDGPYTYGTNNSLEGYNIKNLGGNLHRFTFHILQPDISDTPPGQMSISSEDMGKMSFDCIIFSTKVEFATLITPEDMSETYPNTLFTEHPALISTMNSPILLLPWKGLDIPQNTTKVEVALTLDLEDIIEVYDASGIGTGPFTPIIANRFWERFNIKATFTY